MRYTKAWILAAALSLPIAAATAEPAQASASVSLSFFYDSLSHHGDWFVSADYGYVWRPYGISASWRPYSDGRWVYSDYGWTFVSNASWGWGPYHYGRWTYDPYYGWVWVPGTEWAPAWVTFYEGPGWIGWAPLPPRVSYVSWRSGYVDPRAFCFVESRYFLDSNVHRRIAPLSYNTRLVRTARDISRFSRHRDAVVNVGPSIDRIEKATRTRVRRYRAFDHADIGRVTRTQIRGDAVEVFRPRVTGKATHPPKVKEDRSRRGRDARAVTADRGRSSKAVERPAPQVKPKEPKKVERKPPAAISRSSTREIRTPVVSRDTREQVARKPETNSKAMSRRSVERPSRQPVTVERTPRRATTSQPQVRDDVRSRSNSPSVATSRNTDPRRDAALERARIEQAKVASAKKQQDKERGRKPSNERKPPRG